MSNISRLFPLVPLRNVRQQLARGAVAATLSVTASCRSAPPRTPEDCAGQEFLVVDNRTNGAVDVLLVKGTSSEIIGSAGPGRSAFSLISLNVTANSRFAARRPHATYLSSLNSVTFRRECR